MTFLKFAAIAAGALAIGYLATPASGNAAALGSFGSSGLSYKCGKAQPGGPVPEDTRVCTCEKSVAGDCRAMADEACRNGFYTCPVGSDNCWCHESPNGPQAPKKNAGSLKLFKGLKSKSSVFQLSK